LALPSPGWIPLCLYQLRIIQASGGPGLPSRGFAIHGAGSLVGTAPPGNALHFSPNGYYLFNPVPLPPEPFLPHNACFFGAWLPALPVPGALPPGLSILCLAHQGFRNPFSALAGLRTWWVGRPLVPAGLFSLRAALLRCFPLRACPL
jgi:hypothetical protein